MRVLRMSPARIGLTAAALMVAATGCGGGSSAAKGPGPTAPNGGTGTASTASVTSLGAESGAARLAAARAVAAPPPVTVPLTADGKADVAKWPDACSLLTAAQIKALVPGSYTLTPVGSINTIPPVNGVGQPARPDQCEWRLGGGSFGTRFSVILTDQAAAADNQPAGNGPVVDEGGGVMCQTSDGSVDCSHGTWGYQVLGALVGANGEGVTDSPDLITKLLTPVAVLVGATLQG